MDPESSILLTESFNYWIVLGIGALILLLILSAMISGAEVAFFSLAQPELDKASESRSNHQKMVVSLLEKPQKLLATILISNNFINILIVLMFA